MSDCTIDKYEQPRLQLLLKIFFDYEIVCNNSHNPAGTQGKNFSFNEFAFLFFLRKYNLFPKQLEKKIWSHLLETGDLYYDTC